MAVYTLIVFIAAIFVGAFAFFPADIILTYLWDRLEIPSTMGGGWVNFLMATQRWILLIIVLIPITIWVIRQTQRPKLGERYRGI